MASPTVDPPGDDRPTDPPAPAVPPRSTADPAPGADPLELRPVSFSAKALQHGRHPTRLARMERPDAKASRLGWCGELMEMYLRVQDDRIVDASFWADGCVSTMACADMITTMVRGMTLDEARAITPGELVRALDGLPYASQHCAELSVDTLRDALDTLRPRDIASGS